MVVSCTSRNIRPCSEEETAKQTFGPGRKNMRWALNKFFYTRHKNSLSTSYALMLKKKIL